MKISAHFTNKDFTCNCGCEEYIKDDSLLNVLEMFRAYLCSQEEKNIPIIIHCTVRCAKHNKKIGGVSQSRHLPKFFKKNEGAADLHCRGISVKKLHKYAKKLWNKQEILKGGLGCYDWGIHIDNSSYRRWGK